MGAALVSLQGRPRAELATAAALALVLGLLAALSSPWGPIAALLVVGGVAMVIFRPEDVLAALVILFAVYFWLDAVLFPQLPPIVSLAASAVKEVALFALLLVALARFRAEWLPRDLQIVLVAFGLLVLALTVVPAAPPITSVLGARYHLEYLLLIPIGVGICRLPLQRRRILLIVLGAGALIATVWLSAVGWAGLGELQFSMARTQVLFGENSEVVNAINVLGIYMAITICFALGAGEHARSRWLKLLLLAGIFVLGWCLLSTFSRRSILGLVIGALAIAGAGRKMKTLIWAGVAGGLVLAYSSAQFLRRLTWAAADETGGVSLRVRHVWYTIESLDPLSVFVGHGVGTAGNIGVSAGVRGAVDLHNYYLLLLYESGIAGLTLYLLVCWFAIRELLRAYRLGHLTPSDRGLLLGTIGAFVTFLVAGLFGVTNATIPIAPLIWTMVGCGLAIAPRAGSTP